MLPKSRSLVSVIVYMPPNPGFAPSGAGSAARVGEAAAFFAHFCGGCLGMQVLHDRLAAQVACVVNVGFAFYLKIQWCP